MKLTCFIMASMLACYALGQGDYGVPVAEDMRRRSIVTGSQVTAMKSALTEQLRGSVFPDATNSRGFSFSLPADYLRLSFHTCPGRCNGCLNLDQKGNEGLETPIYLLYNLYKDVQVYNAQTSKDILGSFADFIALAGITAAEFAAGFQTCPASKPRCSIPKPKLTFKTGRRDCIRGKKGPFENRVRPFPEAHDGYEKTVDFFQKQFNMNGKETVAALGAHTLGFCSQHHSGYLGAWVADVSRLDNDYYKVMIDRSLNWTQKNIQPNPNRKKFFQWNPSTGNQATDSIMMLNVDMGLFLDLKVNAEGESSCSYSTCGRSPGAKLVGIYAGNNRRWLKDFSAAYQKIIDNGYRPTALRLPNPYA